MMTVALVATFATAALWNQWRSVEVETADRARVQAAWILTGALDWSRLILREDARSGGADHLAEPWAVPLQEARLSTFLAADPSNTVENDADTTFLSGEIVDMQSLLNARNLVEEGGTLSTSGMRSFSRLFELLGLPQQQLTRMAENLRFASDTNAGNLSAGQAPLMPQSLEQLAWVGLPAETIAALEPYVTILPARTAVNLNTAPAEVIYAVGIGIGMADAQRLVAERGRQHFRSVQDATRLLATPNDPFATNAVDFRSRYFEVRGRLRMNDVVIEERSLVQRSGSTVRTVQREHGGFQSAFGLPAGPPR
ncbi:MAG: general secretion pathway protein GspK [Comamonadaceae bacterium]|nr:MAG: general secretion pathway protein GspK [Comamonadaceae bacterium]